MLIPKIGMTAGVLALALCPVGYFTGVVLHNPIAEYIAFAVLSLFAVMVVCLLLTIWFGMSNR